jgi:hypothetical protein
MQTTLKEFNLEIAINEVLKRQTIIVSNKSRSKFNLFYAFESKNSILSTKLKFQIFQHCFNRIIKNPIKIFKRLENQQNFKCKRSKTSP